MRQLLGWDAAEKALSTRLSGRRAERWTLGIAQFHREPGTPGHREAAQYVTRELERYPFDTVECRPYPWDGKASFADTWYSVATWTPRKGVLRLTHPHEMLLCDFDEIPVVLGIRSGPTPAGGKEYEVVYVGRGITASEYEGKDVRGKLVLTEANGQLGPAVMDMAREKGAAGVLACNLIDVPHITSRPDRADLVPHLWTTYWWLGTEHDWTHEIFSFSLTHRQMLYLKELLVRGPLRMHADVDVELGPGTVDQVSALIRGSEEPESEFVYLGHLDHPWPGAWDNASGCGTCMEVVAALALAIRDKVLPRPRRSIRILLDVHLMGPLMWASDHEGWTDRIVGGVALDGIGLSAGVREAARPLHLSRTSDTVPCYLNDVIEVCLEEASTKQFRSAHSRLVNGPGLWPYRVTPFSLGTDNGPLNDRSFGVPAAYLGQAGGSSTYHTDQDSGGRFDPQEFERTGWVVGMAGWLLANMDPKELPTLAMLVKARSRQRVAAAAAENLWELHRLGSSGMRDHLADAVADFSRKLVYLVERDTAAVASVSRLDRGAAKTIDPLAEQTRRELADLAHGATRQMEEYLAAQGLKLPPARRLSNLEQECDRLVPARKWQGPFNHHEIRRVLSQNLGRAETAWITEFQAGVPYPSLSFSGLPQVLMGIDGRSSILEVADNVRFEQGWAPALDVILPLLRQMAKVGLVELRPR